MSDFWIMRPFSPLFFLLFALFLLLLIVSSLLLRKKSERTRAMVIACACWVTLLGFIAYKYALSVDAEFNELTAVMGGFNWWGELPLQLCNINMILIPIAALSGKRILQCFCFFMGPLGAGLALALPGIGFEHYSILLPRMIGYYGTHWMVVFGSLALGALGLDKPKYKDYLLTLASAFGISFLIFLVNSLLRVTKLNLYANYFFTHEPEGNPILELFHSWLPFPFLCLIPCALILTPYVFLVVSIVRVATRGAKEAEEKAD